MQTHPKVPGGAQSFKEYTNTREKQDKKQIIKLGDLIPLALSKRKERHTAAAFSRRSASTSFATAALQPLYAAASEERASWTVGFTESDSVRIAPNIRTAISVLPLKRCGARCASCPMAWYVNALTCLDEASAFLPYLSQHMLVTTV
jgi:hypothetical protein